MHTVWKVGVGGMYGVLGLRQIVPAAKSLYSKIVLDDIAFYEPCLSTVQPYHFQADLIWCDS